jgi:transcriptional regulator with XRE-family HTH domain
MPRPKKTLNSHRLGELIAAKRRAAGLTQSDLAEALGIGPEAMSRIERGITAASVERLNAVANATGCSLNELLLTAGNTVTDNTMELEGLMQNLSAADRTVVLEMVRILCSHLKSRIKPVRAT